MYIPLEIRLRIKEKSRNPGILVLKVLLYTNCCKTLIGKESNKQSWNSRILVLGGGFVLNPLLLKSNQKLKKIGILQSTVASGFMLDKLLLKSN